MRPTWPVFVLALAGAGCGSYQQTLMAVATRDFCVGPTVLEGGPREGFSSLEWSATCHDGRTLRCTGEERTAPATGHRFIDAECQAVEETREATTPPEPEPRTSAETGGASDAEQEIHAAPPRQESPAEPLSEEEILAVLNAAEREARACVTAGEYPDSVVVGLQLNGDGSCIYLGADPSPPPSVAPCLRGLFNSLRFRATGAPPMRFRAPPLVLRQRVTDSW